MPLKEQLNADLRDSLRSGDETRKGTIRMVLAAIRNAEIAAGQQFEDEGITSVLTKEAKQRRESIEEFGKAKRQDLVDKESAELGIILTYLPAQMSRPEIEEAARKVIEQVGAKGPADKGKVMGPLIGQLREKADGREVNTIVTEMLAAMG
jgi:uncharacterized protein YqeY